MADSSLVSQISTALNTGLTEAQNIVKAENNIRLANAQTSSVVRSVDATTPISTNEIIAIVAIVGVFIAIIWVAFK